MNLVLCALIILSGGTEHTTTTVVGHYPQAVCQAMADRHNRSFGHWSTAYCNPERS